LAFLPIVMYIDGVSTEAPASLDRPQLQQELERLRAWCDELVEQLRQKDRAIDGLQHKLQYLLRRVFGRSAEKLDPNQMLLFDELLNTLAPETPAPPPAESTVETCASPKPANGHGRRRIPADIERQQVIHDLPEEEKPCPCCGKMRHVIGRETSEQLDYEPAKVTAIEHVRLKYVCPECEKNAAEGGPQITIAELPLSPIEKGLAAPGLLSYVIVSKYSDHLPLYRLEKILDRHGIQIARSTMCDWAAQCAEVLDPLYRKMIEEVLGSDVIHTDDTPVDVLDRTLNQTRTGRFWDYLGDHGHPQTVFTYTPSRSRDGPMEFLKNWGKDRRVHLQADAFGGYDGIYRGEAGGQVAEVACWAHARRKFYDARNSDAAASTQALAYIRLLYDVEKQAKQTAERSSFDPEALDGGMNKPSNGGPVADADRFHEQLVSDRYRLRQELAVPRLAQFKTWLESQQAANGGPILPKSPMGQAITYAMNQWEALCVYSTDGRLNIDNNAAENALRRIAVGRKNWLFCGSDNGGATAAVLFSFIATCERHKVDPFAYLRDVLTRIAATPLSQLDQLLPDRWQPTTPAN
jgi:transposase